MALRKNTVIHPGIEVTDAYHRVGNVTVTGKTRLVFKVYSLKDGSQFADRDYSCGYDINGGNPISQAYAHLKTLAEFSGSEDC